MSSNLSRFKDHFCRYVARSSICAAAFGIALAASASPASAGFLDSLFAPQRPAAPILTSYPIEAPLTVPLVQRPARPAPIKKAHIARATAAEPAAIDASDRNLVPDDGAVDFALNDPTLRTGDAIMTKDGIRIFQGPISSHHSARDFVPLAAAKNSKDRTELAQVDAPANRLLPVMAAVQPQSKPKALVAQRIKIAPKAASQLAFADQ